MKYKFLCDNDVYNVVIESDVETWDKLTEIYFSYLQSCGFVLTSEMFAEEVYLKFAERISPIQPVKRKVKIMLEYYATPFWKEDGSNMTWDEVYDSFNMTGGVFAKFVDLSTRYTADRPLSDPRYYDSRLLNLISWFKTLNPEVDVITSGEEE